MLFAGAFAGLLSTIFLSEISLSDILLELRAEPKLLWTLPKLLMLNALPMLLRLGDLRAVLPMLYTLALPMLLYALLEPDSMLAQPTSDGCDG